MKYKIIIVVSTLLLVVLMWKSHKSIETSVSSEKQSLTKNDLRLLPKVVSNAVFDDGFDSIVYKKNIREMKMAKEQHLELGERTYTLALSKAFYSKEKIRLLKIAKEHLLLSQELRGTL